MKKLNDLLSEVTKLRSEIKTVQAEEKLLKTQQRELESQISIRMQEQGLDKISNDVCTISLKNEIVPTVEDWDQLHEHITDTGQFELLQKRVSRTLHLTQHRIVQSIQSFLQFWHTQLRHTVSHFSKRQHG